MFPVPNVVAEDGMGICWMFAVFGTVRLMVTAGFMLPTALDAENQVVK